MQNLPHFSAIFWKILEFFPKKVYIIPIMFPKFPKIIYILYIIPFYYTTNFRKSQISAAKIHFSARGCENLTNSCQISAAIQIFFKKNLKNTKFRVIIYIESKGRNPKLSENFSEKRTNKNLKNSKFYVIIYIESEREIPNLLSLIAAKRLENLAAQEGCDRRKRRKARKDTP